jgi:pyruvate ferredoxin oxidoreductase alpha subunit
MYTVIAGLGGRPIQRTSVRNLLESALADNLEQLTFLDLDTKLVAAELQRNQEKRRSGPIAENLLRDLGQITSPIGMTP